MVVTLITLLEAFHIKILDNFTQKEIAPSISFVLGLFIEHWKTLLKSEFTERAFDVNSDHFLVPVDIGHSHSVDDKANDSDTEKNLQLLSDDEPEMGAQPGVSDAGVGKCVTCTKLGILCMYDIERVNKKPFWIEARKHFRNISKSLTPGSSCPIHDKH